MSPSDAPPYIEDTATDTGDDDVRDSAVAEPDTDVEPEADDDLAHDTDADADGDTDDAAPLTAVTDLRVDAFVGEPIILDGSRSTGAVAYLWDFGDGTRWESPRASAVAEHVYDAPGRYRAVLSAFDAPGNRRTAQLLVTVTQRPVFAPAQSATVVRAPNEDVFIAVSPDSDEVIEITRVDTTFVETRRWTVCAHPRTVAASQTHYAATCQNDDAVWIADRSTGDQELVQLRYGARPFGVVAHRNTFVATLQGTGAVVVIASDDDAFAVTMEINTVADARGLATLPDGWIVVSGWRSTALSGALEAIQLDTQERRTISLEYDDQEPSDTEGPGVPTYLGAPAVSSNGREITIPSTQANILDGLALSGRPFTFDTTMRAVASFVAWPSGLELDDRRHHFDDRGLAAAAIYSSAGDFLYVVMRGARSIERLDALTGSQSGSILDVGYAPDGIALSMDDTYILVNVSLSREVVVYDVTDFTSLPTVDARVSLVQEEPLDPTVLRGKQLFNDTFDDRLARASYIACAHCHLDGEADRLTWDFTQRGEGLRNTTSLLGRRGMGHGPVHWSANFDEIQDFEHDIRDHAGGRGLMHDDDFFADGRDHPLGAVKAGISADLDALAAYVSSLDTYPRSPYRDPAGELTPEATLGRAIFVDALTQCTSCHSGPDLTDSGFDDFGHPILHNVGTLGSLSGHRLGEELPGIDTPTLHELFNSAPYLHDGSAATLREVLVDRNPEDRHGRTSHLDEADIENLIAYLLSLDGRLD